VVIDQAALRRMSKVRQHQIGPHSDQSQEILSDLARARLILMDPDRRSDYDAKLRARGKDLPVRSAASKKHGNGAATLDGPDQSAPDVFASLALSLRAGDRPSSLDGGRSERSSGWKKVALVAAYASLLVAFIVYVVGSPSHIQKILDLVRGDPDRLAQQPKPSVPPTSKPIFPPRPGPQRIVVPPRAAPPREEGKPETHAVVTQGDKNEGDDGPAGPGQASDRSDPNKDKPDLAAVGSPEHRLNGLGLQRMGSLYVLKQESEVRQKLEQAQGGWNQCLSSLSQKDEMEAKKATFDSLSDAIIALRHDIDSANLALRVWPPRYSNVEKDNFRAAEVFRDSLDGELIEARTQLDRLRSQLPTPRAIQEMDAKIQSLRQECESTVGEARELINSTDASYERLAKNDDVTAALAELERKSKGKLKLGHTPEYGQIVKRIEQLEKSLNPPGSLSPGGERDKAGKGDKSSFRRDRKKG